MSLHPLAGGALCMLAVLASGCGRAPEREPPRRTFPLAVDVRADTGRTITLDVPPPAPAARVWAARVSLARASFPPPPVPEPAPDSAAVTAFAVPPAFAVDAGLKPPILRQAAPLWVPAGAAAAQIELDVNVDETGAVTDVEWASGARDTALVRAARRCAFAMRFFPAERAGRPVAVWCRQRFDFGSGSVVP